MRLAPRSPSPVAVGLGRLALLPFAAGAPAAWTVDEARRPLAAETLSAYAATVVSFIGAIHRGLAFRIERARPGLFVWGVAPALVAGIAVPAPPRHGLALPAAMLAACYGAAASSTRAKASIDGCRCVSA